MSLIESYGTGISKIQRAYKGESLQPKFETAKGVFRVTLPNRNENSNNNRNSNETRNEKQLENHQSSAPEYSSKKESLNVQKQMILAFVRKNGKITRSQVEKLLGAGTTKAFRLLKELCEDRQWRHKVVDG